MKNRAMATHCQGATRNGVCGGMAHLFNGEAQLFCVAFDIRTGEYESKGKEIPRTKSHSASNLHVSPTFLVVWHVGLPVAGSRAVGSQKSDGDKQSCLMTKLVNWPPPASPLKMSLT